MVKVTIPQCGYKARAVSEKSEREKQQRAGERKGMEEQEEKRKSAEFTTNFWLWRTVMYLMAQNPGFLIMIKNFKL